jgi:hypothetical protein
LLECELLLDLHEFLLIAALDVVYATVEVAGLLPEELEVLLTDLIHQGGRLPQLVLQGLDALGLGHQTVVQVLHEGQVRGGVAVLQVFQAEDTVLTLFLTHQGLYFLCLTSDSLFVHPLS